MKQITLKIEAGKAEEIAVSGDYVRIKTASVAVRLRDANSDVDATIEQGDALNLKPFTRLNVSHADGAEQTITLLIGNGTSSDSARVGGSVVVSGMPNQAGLTAPLQAIATVTSVSSIPLAQLQDTPTRRYLMVQNKSATGTIYLNFIAAASAANGLKIAPGESFEMTNVVITSSVRIIGDIASNAEVVVVTA